MKWTELSSGETEKVIALGEEFKIDPIALEDCLQKDQRAKLEDFGTHQYLVWFMYLGGEVHEMQFVIFPDHVIFVFHHNAPNGTDWKTHFRLHSDYKDSLYLIYQVLDRATDITSAEVRSIFLKIQDFEQSMFESGPLDARTVLSLKRTLLEIEFSIGQLPSVAKQIQNHFKLRADLQWKLRDLHDHCERIDKAIDFHVSQISSSIDLLWGFEANRTNMQVKKLSVLAGVAVPLTFWAAFWGMNFEALNFHDDRVFYMAMALMLISTGATYYTLKVKGYWSD